MTIYDRVKELAKSRNISIRELEKRLGFGNGTISKWIDSGSIEKVSKVANYFHVSIDYLLGKEEPQQIDIGKQTEDLLDAINMNNVQFFGTPMTDEDREAFASTIETALIANKYKAEQKKSERNDDKH